ncbi:adenylyl-sulfate kinase [Devosia sp.]|uniref:adenylyl-sulfate kinase n=1 Tax=Devosia sp. TaxID=1871048 RepID=UPI002736EB12|nr:adenylyl-sulfate kinase [Devosia sp.]MDP2779061.1 adenylyl-sulfate kinase [Devosia sp.]
MSVKSSRLNQRFLNLFKVLQLFFERAGLYQRARAGEIANFTGISAPYEPPETPAGSIDTGLSSLDDAIAQLIRILEPRLRLTTAD